jgi:hypothetical protein
MEKTNAAINSPLLAETAKKLWYAVHTTGCRELIAKEYLQEQGLQCFVPMTYSDTDRKGQPTAKHLVPAVHNLLFFRTPLAQRHLSPIINNCPFPIWIYTKENSMNYFPITDSEMAEIRLLCDPEYKLTEFIPRNQAEAKVGKQVRIIKGPFSGITGKLVRIGPGYFFIKTVFNMGIMLRISRWYCSVIE